MVTLLPNLAFYMKIIRRILLLLLSVIILFVGRGVDIVHCVHDGTVKMLTCLQGEAAHDDEEHLPPCGCLSVGHVEVSPTKVQPTVDFQAVPPLLAVLPALVVVLQPVLKKEHEFAAVYTVYQRPPRSYLRLIRILLI